MSSATTSSKSSVRASNVIDKCGKYIDLVKLASRSFGIIRRRTNRVEISGGNHSTGIVALVVPGMLISSSVNIGSILARK